MEVLAAVRQGEHPPSGANDWHDAYPVKEVEGTDTNDRHDAYPAKGVEGTDTNDWHNRTRIKGATGTNPNDWHNTISDQASRPTSGAMRTGNGYGI
ncbi:hypothetical protein GCM10007392_07060 [Saccharospirillum salsuginis]|uniref:Uncharacterized protein n=1 Tax=Saccharospirillum salsuginis TaxID=418750 RepID=A0A918N750_9GAMM|nr:hypothetical protein GCM10007392_07060 [Saccharospirillum salsuginis]